MGFNPKDYPITWPAFSLMIRQERAGRQCECTGECGLHGPSLFKPGPRRCVERDGEPAKWAKGKVMLTVAHLNAKDGPCRCSPLCARPDHVRAFCQRCHLRYDQERHIQNATRSREEKNGRRNLAKQRGIRTE